MRQDCGRVSDQVVAGEDSGGAPKSRRECTISLLAAGIKDWCYGCSSADNMLRGGAGKGRMVAARSLHGSSGSYRAEGRAASVEGNTHRFTLISTGFRLI